MKYLARIEALHDAKVAMNQRKLDAAGKYFDTVDEIKDRVNCLKRSQMDVWIRIMVLFVIQINIIGASDVDPYSSPVPRVGFSTGVFFKYPSGTFTRHHA